MVAFNHKSSTLTVEEILVGIMFQNHKKVGFFDNLIFGIEKAIVKMKQRVIDTIHEVKPFSVLDYEN